MNTYRIVLLPGDGIGPEVMTEAVNVLNVTGELFGFGLHYQKNGVTSKEVAPVPFLFDLPIRLPS